MGRTFAERLARLFDEVRAPDGRRWENRQVVEAINAGGRAKISASYLSELLSGKKDNPSIWTVKALADFFGQSVEYFVDDTSPNPLGARTASASSGLPTATLADRLEVLFTVARQPSDAEVASAVASTVDGFDVERLTRLRAGVETEASDAELAALAGYFVVPVAALTDPQVAELIATNLPAMELLGDEAVRKIAFRAQALSPRDRAMVAGLVARLTVSEAGMATEDLDF